MAVDPMLISEERLNLKLKRSIQSLINREDHRFKKGANNLKSNPGSLRSRVLVLEEKYHDLYQNEYKRNENNLESIRNLDVYEVKLKFKMLYTHALVVTTLQTSRDIIKNSIYQWGLFMSNYKSWMGGYVQEEGESFQHFYRRLTPLGALFTKETLSRVQQ